MGQLRNHTPQVGALLVLLLTACCLAVLPGEASMAAAREDTASAVAEPSGTREAPPDCQKIVDLLEQQKSLLTRETGQLKRELAALREDLSKPGLREILGGIGYIFGLVGVALYVHSRKTKSEPLKRQPPL